MLLLTATVLVVVVVVVLWLHTLRVVGEVFILHHPLLGCPLLKPIDILWIHWSPTEDEACLFWWVLILSSSLGLDHGHVLGRLGVLGVQVPFLDLRFVLLLANNDC